METNRRIQQKEIGEANEYEGLVTLDPIGLLIECPSFRLSRLADNDLIVRLCDEDERDRTEYGGGLPATTDLDDKPESAVGARVTPSASRFDCE